MSQDYRIQKVENGWLCWCVDNSGERIVVAQETSDEVDCFIAFLYAIVEHFGPVTSRYSEKRISICAVPGDKCDEISEAFVEKAKDYLLDFAYGIGIDNAIKYLQEHAEKCVH